MAISRRIGEALKGFAGGFLPAWQDIQNRELEGKKLDLTESELEALNQYRLAHGRFYNTQSDAIDRAMMLIDGFMGTGGRGENILRGFRPEQPSLGGRVTLPRATGSDPQARFHPALTPGREHARQFSEPLVPKKFDLDRAGPLYQDPAQLLTRPTPSAPGQMPSPPASGPLQRAFSQHTAAQSPNIVRGPTAPDYATPDQFDRPFSTRQPDFRSGVTETLNRGRLPEHLDARLALGLLSGATGWSGMGPNPILGAARDPFARELAEHLYTVREEMLTRANIDEVTGRGPVVSMNITGPRGERRTMQIPQATMFASPEWRDRNNIDLGGTASEDGQSRTFSIPSSQSAATGASGQDGITRTPEGGVISQEMTTLQQQQLLPLGGLQRMVDEIGEMAVMLNTMDSFASVPSGMMRTAGSWFNVSEAGQLQRQYNDAVQSFAAQFARLGGESGGRLSDFDVERAIRMLPAATDTKTQAQSKIARMKEFLTIQYLTSIQGTPAFPEHGPPGMDVFDNPSLQEMYPGLGNQNRGDLRIEGLWGNTPPTTTEEVR